MTTEVKEAGAVGIAQFVNGEAPPVARLIESSDVSGRLALPVDVINAINLVLEGGNTNAVLVTAENLDIRPLTKDVDTVRIEGSNTENVVTEPLHISKGKVASLEHGTTSATSIVTPTNLEGVIVGSLIITNEDSDIVGVNVFEQGNSATPEFRIWAAANGGGGTWEIPLGWHLQQGQALQMATAVNAATADSVRVSVNYKLATFDSALIEEGDAALLESGDGILLESGDALLLDTGA